VPFVFWKRSEVTDLYHLPYLLFHKLTLPKHEKWNISIIVTLTSGEL
jgi:hypothetical protein